MTKECSEFFSCQKSTCAKQNTKTVNCWELEGTLCKTHMKDYDFLINHIGSKDETCKLCAYYVYRRNVNYTPKYTCSISNETVKPEYKKILPNKEIASVINIEIDFNSSMVDIILDNGNGGYKFQHLRKDDAIWFTAAIGKIFNSYNLKI